MSTSEAILYWIKSKDGDAAILKTPSEINFDNADTDHEIFNIIMIDVSGSMDTSWHTLMLNWNEKISPNLKGDSSIYTFGESVKFRRHKNDILSEDFDNSMTNLTDAIKEIHYQVHRTPHKNVRVFLVTDGHHNATRIEPEVAIAGLRPPREKSIEVFILALGKSFPVEYSITIRSKLHTGNSNLPSIFWAKECRDIESQLDSIEGILKLGSVKLNISIPGALAPGISKTNSLYLGEFVYFDDELESLSQIKFKSEKLKQIPIKVIPSNKLTIEVFLETILRQWNSILIQQHKQKKSVPMSIFDTIDSIYKELLSKINGSNKEIASIVSRLEAKNIKTLEVTYATIVNQSKKIIGAEGQYLNELQLAEDILKTTVQTKYDTKNLKMRGYGDESYQEDIKKFQTIYTDNKKYIMDLPEPPPDECCSVTLGSMVKDLQDEDFHLLLEEDKFSFMKTFCVTGIPILTAIKDASQINPWTLKIKNILVSPFSIISQTVIELSANSNLVTDEDKSVYLQEGEEASHMNAVVPVFSEVVAKVLKPLIRTKIFGMISTFCILKNPHILDMNVHLAALSVIFMKTIKQYPLTSRPEFIAKRISLLESTGNLYLDRKGFANYVDILFSEPKEALMTESNKLFPDSTIKCESLSKPCFFIFLKRNDIQENKSTEIKNLMELIVMEFVGRCLSNYQPEESNGEFTSFFAKGLYTAEERAKSIEAQLQANIGECPLNTGNILEKAFIAKDLLKQINDYVDKCFMTSLKGLSEIEVDMEKVQRLYNLSSAGDLNLKGLQIFAEEIGLSSADIDEIFSPKKMLVFVFHALQHRNSRDRLSEEILDYQGAMSFVQKKIKQENLNAMRNSLKKMLKDTFVVKWKAELTRVHRSIAVPLSKEDIIEKASQRGVSVTLENFKKVFKYNPKSGLMRNACMIEDCPHFLKPHRSFNEHLFVEREHEYPHELHRVARSVADKGGGTKRVVEELLSGAFGGTNKRKKPKCPSREYVSSFQDQIEQLLVHYSQFSTS